MPLKIFKVNVDEIELIVCIALSMINILKRDLMNILDACKAKNIKINVRNMKYIISVCLIGIIRRTNEIDEALNAKGKCLVNQI